MVCARELLAFMAVAATVFIVLPYLEHTKDGGSSANGNDRHSWDVQRHLASQMSYMNTCLHTCLRLAGLSCLPTIVG